MRKKLLIGIGVSIVISLLLVLTRDSYPSLLVQGITQHIYQEPKAALYNFSASARSDSEIDQLRKENTELRELAAELEHIKSDNIALKSQFEEPSIESSNLLPATIVGFHGQVNNPEVLVINRGVTDKLQKGKAVIVGKNLIGIIDSVSDRYSTVRLITDPQFSTVAKSSSDTTLGVAQGANEFILFDNVAVTSELAEGDTIVTKGDMSTEEVGIPPELILGKVSSIRRVESEPFQSAQVISLVEIKNLTKVFILL